jgi:hypothetical protein
MSTEHIRAQGLGTFGATTPSIAYQDADPYGMLWCKLHVAISSFSLSLWTNLLRLRGRRKCLTLTHSFSPYATATDLLAPSAGVDLALAPSADGERTLTMKTEDSVYTFRMFFFNLWP